MKPGDRVQVLVMTDPDTYRVATIKSVSSWCVIVTMELSGLVIETVQEHIIPITSCSKLAQAALIILDAQKESANASP